MDEPFGALDAQTRETLQGELCDIQERTGKTIVFVTHDLDEAVLLADRIIVMRDGAVQEEIAVPLPKARRSGGAPRHRGIRQARHQVWNTLHGRSGDDMKT